MRALTAQAQKRQRVTSLPSQGSDDAARFNLDLARVVEQLGDRQIKLELGLEAGQLR